jgi:hypothetical protein
VNRKMGKNDAASAQDKSVTGAKRANRGQQKAIGSPETQFSFDSKSTNDYGFSKESVAVESAPTTISLKDAIARRTPIMPVSEEMSTGLVLRRKQRVRRDPEVFLNDNGVVTIG